MNTYFLSSHQKEPQHGDKLSPYALYHCVFSSAASQVLLHWHEEAEFTIIRQGQATYQVGQELFTVKQGDLLFIAPNTLHSIHPADGMTTITDTLVFHLDMIGCSAADRCALTYLRPFLKGSLKLTPHILGRHPAYHELFTCMDTALGYVKEPPLYHEFLLREKLNRLFFLLFRHGCLTETTLSKASALYTEKVKHALLFIQENYKEPITVNQLARLCNFSEVHFMNFFKKTVGIPCMEYIIQLRLKIAADLLCTTDFSVAEIALESGFNNLSNFNRKFKEYYHQTPSGYRKGGAEEMQA